jgi:DnaJ family protein C protein 19
MVTLATIVMSAVGVTGGALALRAGLRTFARSRALKNGVEAAVTERSSLFTFGSKKGTDQFIPGTFEAEMSREEAAQILNVSEKSTEDEIRKAHRKMMIVNHPDSGGSTYLSSKINEAKEVMLGGRAGRSRS